MKSVYSIIAVLGLALVIPAIADAATGDPEVIIYRFSGVTDDGGGANTGVATAFHCTNFSGETENLRFVSRSFNGQLRNNVLAPRTHLQTLTAVTHNTNAYNEDSFLNTAELTQGSTAIAATTTSMVCTAETIDASAAKPVGVARHGIRFNPAPGSQE